MRNQISKTSPYYISKHRYLELKHFCLQYPEWEEAVKTIKGRVPEADEKDPTGNDASMLADLKKRMELVNLAAKGADTVLAPFIFAHVTKGCTYERLRIDGIPCCRESFYIYLRKFFYLLNVYKG